MHTSMMGLRLPSKNEDSIVQDLRHALVRHEPGQGIKQVRENGSSRTKILGQLQWQNIC